MIPALSIPKRPRQRCRVEGAPLGQHLQLDGGLRLVGDAMPNTQQRCDGVEQPAHARGRHAPDVALDLSAHHRQLHVVAGGNGGQRRVGSDAERSEVCHRDPARVAHRTIATGERQRAQVSGADEAGVVGDEHLAAPDLGRAIVADAVAGAVEGDADHRRGAVEAVLGHHRRDVSMVVLHLDQCSIAAVLHGPPTSEVTGVPIRRDHRRASRRTSAGTRRRFARTHATSPGSPCRRCAG